MTTAQQPEPDQPAVSDAAVEAWRRRDRVALRWSLHLHPRALSPLDVKAGESTTRDEGEVARALALRNELMIAAGELTL